MTTVPDCSTMRGTNRVNSCGPIRQLAVLPTSGAGHGLVLHGVDRYPDYLPTSHPQRSSLIAIVERTATAVMAFQESHSGLWCRCLIKAVARATTRRLPPRRCSVISIEAARLGYLSAPTQAREAACKAFRALCETRLSTSADGATHLMASARWPDSEASRTVTVHMPIMSVNRLFQNDFKGVGPFLLASIEMAH